MSDGERVVVEILRKYGCNVPSSDVHWALTPQNSGFLAVSLDFTNLNGILFWKKKLELHFHSQHHPTVTPFMPSGI